MEKKDVVVAVGYERIAPLCAELDPRELGRDIIRQYPCLGEARKNSKELRRLPRDVLAFFAVSKLDYPVPVKLIAKSRVGTYQAVLDDGSTMCLRKECFNNIRKQQHVQNFDRDGIFGTDYIPAPTGRL